jgi:hypothetical protein
MSKHQQRVQNDYNRGRRDGSACIPPPPKAGSAYMAGFYSGARKVQNDLLRRLRHKFAMGGE